MAKLMSNVADKVVPLDESDIPALEGLVEALMDQNQRAQWEQEISLLEAQGIR